MGKNKNKQIGQYSPILKYKTSNQFDKSTNSRLICFY